MVAALGIPALLALSALGGGLASGMGSRNAGGSFFGGSPGSYEQVSRLTPEQQQLLGQMFPGLSQASGSGLDYLNQLLSGDDSAFADFEAPFKRQFEQEVIPSIAERFAGLGSHGSQSSSAMQQTLGQSGRELSENLAAMRSNLKQNALGQLQGLMGQAFQPTFESMYRQPTMGALGGLGQGLGQGAGQLFGIKALQGLGVS